MKVKFLFVLTVSCFVFTELKAEGVMEVAPSLSKNETSSQEVFKNLKEKHNENTIFDDLYNIQ
jgi:hypothetical protein